MTRQRIVIYVAAAALSTWLAPALATASPELRDTDAETTAGQNKSSATSQRFEQIETELAALKQKLAAQAKVEKELVFQDTQVHALKRDPANELSRQHAYWIRVPKIDTEVRFGGFVQLNVLYDTAAMGVDTGSFITAAISVPTNEEGNIALDISRSRFIFQSRTKTVWGDAHTFFSIDLNQQPQTGPSLRLRQFYAHIDGLTIGQTMSAFGDIAMWPDSFDAEGPNGWAMGRVPLISYAWAVFHDPKRLILTLSVENPASQVTNANGLMGMPNLVGRIDFNLDWLHLMGAGMVRQIRAQSTTTTASDELWAGAGTLATKIKIPGTNGHTFGVQATGGTGASTRILDTLGLAQDGVWNDATTTIAPLTAFAIHGAYHLVFTSWLRANAIGGYVLFNTVDTQADDAYKETIYANGNLIWRPISRLDIGLQYYYGQRKNEDDQIGRSHRVMGSFHFAF